MGYGFDPSSAPRRPRHAGRGDWQCSVCEEWHSIDIGECPCGQDDERCRTEPLESA
jgi:hypothetical protein